MLHFNPDTQAFKKREEPATESMAAIDDRDFTSSHGDQDNWSLENLPDILYILRPKTENAKSRRVVHMTDHMIFGKKVRNFYTLPPRISSEVEGFRLEAWFRLDRRIKAEDILDRVNPMFRQFISEEIIQERRESFQLAYNVADWSSQRSINAVTRQVKRGGFDVEQNTTRGVTPGLIDPTQGEAGGRVVFNPAVCQQQQPPAINPLIEGSAAWVLLQRYLILNHPNRASLAKHHQTSMQQQQQHGVEQGMEPANAQMMHLAHSHMAAPISNQDNRVNQLNQINYFAAPGSAAPAMGGSYVAPGQQHYYPQIAQTSQPTQMDQPMQMNNSMMAMQTNNSMQADQPMQANHPTQMVPAQSGATMNTGMAGQVPAPRAAAPVVNPRVKRTRVKPNGSPFFSTEILPASAHISPASARIARSGIPNAVYFAQKNKLSNHMNEYQQGMTSVQTAHTANHASTARPETASNNDRVPQFSSELYPFYNFLDNFDVDRQGDAFGGANTNSNAHCGQKRTLEADDNGLVASFVTALGCPTVLHCGLLRELTVDRVPTLTEDERMTDYFDILYPSVIPELAEHSGPNPEEFTQTGDEDLSQEVNFDDWLVESAMSADGHIEWRSGIWPGIGVDPEKTEEEKTKEKKTEEEKTEEEKKKEKNEEESKKKEDKEDEKQDD